MFKSELKEALGIMERIAKALESMAESGALVANPVVEVRPGRPEGATLMVQEVEAALPGWHVSLHRWRTHLWDLTARNGDLWIQDRIEESDFARPEFRSRIVEGFEQRANKMLGRQ